jgi:hypothetical protein
MKTRLIIAKILAIAGNVLVGLPLLTPIVFGLISLISTGQFRFDYLMPAEFFLAVLAGGVLLLVAAIMARMRIKLIAWTLGAVVCTLVVLIVVPILTGADKAVEGPSRGLMVIFQVLIGLYWLAILALLSGGKYLLRDLFKKKEKIV